MNPARLRLLLTLALPLFSSCASFPKPPKKPLAPPPEEHSIKPGINAEFLCKKVELAHWVTTFEGEAREIAVQKSAIVAAMQLKKGDDVADVGSGTGLFLKPLSEAVGVGGKVYALDIAPAFVERLKERASSEGLQQVEPRLTRPRSVDLPDFSLDAALVCDTYHHFEYPQHVLFSLYDALRPSGKLYVVDFERIPGESREFVLEHVRAGKEAVKKEILAAGFVFEEELDVPGLHENYVLRFRRP